MARNFEHALFPLQLLFKLFIFDSWEYFSKRLSIYFSYIYTIIMWSIYLSIIFYLEYHGIWISFQLFIACAVYNSDVLTTIISIINYMYYKQMYKQYLLNISMINNTLTQLRISNEYNNLRKKVTRNIIVWILISIALNITQIPWYTKKVTGKKIYFVPILINHVKHVNNLMDMFYELHLWYLASLFQNINKCILHLSSSKNRTINTMWTTVASKKFRHQSLIDTSQHKYSLLTVMHIHLELCKTCYKLHQVFQVQLTMGVANDFIILVGIICIQCKYVLSIDEIDLEFLKDISSTIVIMFCYAGKVIFVNNAIEKCCKQAYDTANMLHILRDYTCDPERQEEISQFCMQIMQKRLRLSKIGLFHCGHDFICKFFIHIINYIIITMQLNLT